MKMIKALAYNTTILITTINYFYSTGPWLAPRHSAWQHSALWHPA